MASKLLAALIIAACAGAAPVYAQSGTSETPTLAQRAATVAQASADVTGLHAARELHVIYTQLAQHGLWAEMADLFADDAEVIVGPRAIEGKAAIRDWLHSEFGPAGAKDGPLRTTLPFTPVANLAPSGDRATIRWHELGMLGGGGETPRWTGGIYENDYVRRGDTWLIARLHYYPQFAGSYADGWRNVEDDLKVVPMHYTPQTAGIPFPQRAAPAPARDPLATARALVPALGAQLEENAVRNLQNIYGYYVDRRMWDDVADLFEDGATLDIAGFGRWEGRAAIRKGVEREGPAGLEAGELNEHVQFPAIVRISADGIHATARGVELAMTGQNSGKAYWSLSVFENRFVKRDGVWRIEAMQLFPSFRAEYASGWGGTDLGPVAAAADGQPTRASAYAKGAMPAFSYVHPVTGKPIMLSGAAPSGDAMAGAVASRPVPGAPAQAVAQAERLQRLLAADIGAENVSNAFGNYIDDFEWEKLGAIFARKGAREMPFAGFFIGPERISTAEITKWGHRRTPRTTIPIHLRIQPVIDVTSDGRAARFRTRLFSIGSSLNAPGSFSGGMYPNDQAVLEDGVWKLWSVAIDEFYYNSAGYKNGWTNVQAEPAEKRPDMLLGAYRPDIVLSELGQRQQGFIPGSRQFNPYVHNGPAYPGYPSATPMWFHYVNPVSGRVPPYYWPDCVTCAAHPETSLQANGY
jgi:hypothetical protein